MEELCPYLMHEDTVLAPLLTGTEVSLGMNLFDNQIINQYTIVKHHELHSHTPLPDDKPPLNIYTCKTGEDNACCFLVLKRIVQCTETRVYVDKFSLHS